MAAMWQSFDQWTVADKALRKLACYPDRNASPSLFPGRRGAVSHLKKWRRWKKNLALGGLTEKLFTSFCFMLGTTDFYVFKLVFVYFTAKWILTSHIQLALPFAVVSEAAALLLWCFAQLSRSRYIIIINSVKDYILYSKANRPLTKPQKQQAMSWSYAVAPWGPSEGQNRMMTKEKVFNAVLVAKEMGTLPV